MMALAKISAVVLLIRYCVCMIIIHQATRMMGRYEPISTLVQPHMKRTMPPRGRSGRGVDSQFMNSNSEFDDRSLSTI